MFNFFKDKLKSTIKKISNRIEQEGSKEEKEIEVIKEEVSVEEKGFFSKIKDKFARKGEIIEEIEEIKPKKKAEVKLKKEKIEQKESIEEVFKEEIKEAESHKHVEEIKIEEKEQDKTIEEEIIKEELPENKEKLSIFQKIKQKIVTQTINDKQFDDIFYELEIALLENNVAFEVIDKIKKDLKESIVNKPLPRNNIGDILLSSLEKSIISLLDIESFDMIKRIKESKKPYVICFFGINGAGKTTGIAKIANLLKKNNLSCVIAASDTFRAASIEQLQHHADKLNIKMIKHDYNSDPAAVAFDAIKHAEAKNIDVVLVDTAGRMHSNSNLMDEMKKIIRVAKPDLKIFVGEAITGNDCVEQAQKFNDEVGIDAVILTKADVDEKGGAFVSVSYITKKPIIYIGVGQGYDDIQEFNSELVIKNLGLRES